MASERILSSSNPHSQYSQYSAFFKRALLAALGAHALAALGLSFFASLFSSSDAPEVKAPVISASVSLLAVAPASPPASPVISPRPQVSPPRPTVKPVAAKETSALESPVQASQPAFVSQPLKVPENPNPSEQRPPANGSSQALEARPSQAPPSDVVATVAGSTTGLPEARIRASAQCVAPSYPRRSVINNEQGVSQIELRIGEDGRVRESRIAQSSGFFRLDQAALQALSACEFEPERVNGVAREAWARIRYVWRLD